MLVVYSCPAVVGGDLNVHVQDADNVDSRRLGDLLASFDMVREVRLIAVEIRSTSSLRSPIAVPVTSPLIRRMPYQITR